MNKKFIYLLLIGLTLFTFSCQKDNETEKLRAQHQQNLENSPFKKISHLSKKERKSLGIPNTKYEERMWELTMNPALGRPTPENLFDIQKNLERAGTRTTPGDAINAWVERGPNNVGGRTKALLFDPNDATHKRVFAGGISGGLWVNNDITSSSSAWQLVNIPENVAVSSITVDANNSNIFYLGTGESYTSGSVNGNGVWKSVDGGTSWQHIFGGVTGATTYNTDANLRVNSPASVAGDYNAITSSFGSQNFNLTNDLVIVNDGTATPTFGCATLTNAAAVNGKIAVIDRGTCLFVEKVRFAQAAGAVAVLMINNVDGNPIIMGGSGDMSDIVIPAVMITKSQGDAIKAAITGGATVNATITSTDTLVSGAYLVPGQTHVNDIITRNNGGTTEIFVAVGDSYYADASSATVMGTGFQGIYKSSDGGLTWSKLFLPNTASGYPTSPNDLEIGADNSIWMTTTRSIWFGVEGAGQVFNSTDGSLFTLKHTITNGVRTEIAVSKSNANKMYLLAQMNDTAAPVAMYITNDGFASVTSIPIPVDSTTFIPSNDFTNGQSFYDLAIEVDPNNDSTLFVGGIDVFKSTNSGSSWTQVTAGYSGGTGSSIHPDQHNIVFANSNTILLGCDGGVAYSSNGGSTFATRNTNYNTLQFYHMGVAPTTSFPTGDYFMAGAQDNGTQLFQNAPAGIGSSVSAYGGDGGYCFFDQDGTDKYYITNMYYNMAITLYNYATNTTRTINSETAENGEFITPESLDSKNNLLFANYTYYDATNSANNIYRLRRYKNLTSGTVQKLPMTGFTRPASALKASPFTAVGTSVLFVGQDDGKLYRIDNAAANTTTFPLIDITGSGFVGSISDIEFGSSQNEIFVTMYNYGVGSIWYTTDGGTSWVQKEGNLPDMPVNCILRNPLRTEQVIIGTDLGVWYTLDFNAASPVWYRGDNGMKSVKVTSLELRNDNMVFASTFGRGIFSGPFTANDGTVVGVSDETVSVVSAYPNPATDVLHLRSKIALHQPTVILYDISGKMLSKTNYNATSDLIKVNTSKLKSGNYVAKVIADEKIYTTKFIVK